LRRATDVRHKIGLKSSRRPGPAERANPSLLNGSRKNPIAKGAGIDIVAFNSFLKQFELTSKMMRKVEQMSGKRR
jgi:signal recognition particle subunit SRP54